MLFIILSIGLSNILGTVLKDRKQIIIDDLEAAETRLSEANNRLAEIGNQYDQSFVVFNKLQKMNALNVTKLVEPDSSEVKKDLAERFERALKIAKAKEREIFFEIQQQLVYRLLELVVSSVRDVYGLNNDKYSIKRLNDIKEMTYLIDNELKEQKQIKIGNFLATDNNISAIYARALLDFQKKKQWSVGIHITDDLIDLQNVVAKSPELIEYLDNPLISQKAKHEVLVKIFKRQVVSETFDFLIFLVNRNRINILPTIISNYMSLIGSSIQKVEVTAVKRLTPSQENKLITILKELINVDELEIIYNFDSSVLSGFIIKIESIVMDFSVKEEVQQYARYFDIGLEI